MITKIFYQKWISYINENKDTKKTSKVLILNEDDEALILKRNKDSNFKPLHWDFPGGHIKINEEEIDAAVRETKEETSLNIENLKKIETIEDISFFKTNEYSGDIKLDKSENEEYEWVSKKDLDKYKWSPHVKEIIDKFS